MNNAGGRMFTTSAAVLGISVMGALGAGTAFASVPAAPGGSAGGHGAAVADPAEQSIPTSSKSADLHSFVTPTMATHVAKPDMAYDDGNYNDSSYNDRGYGDRSYGNYGDSNYAGKNYNDSYSSGNRNGDYGDYDRGASGNYRSRYSDSNYYNGYGDNGYRHNDDGLFGGGLLGKNN